MPDTKIKRPGGGFFYYRVQCVRVSFSRNDFHLRFNFTFFARIFQAIERRKLIFWQKIEAETGERLNFAETLA